MHALWRFRKTSVVIIPGLLALASCSSPPKPPTVDGAHRHPVNVAAAIDLQICRIDLQNTRILANESGRAAELASASLTNLVARQRALAALSDPSQGAPTRSVGAPAAHGLFSVRFAYGSAQVQINEPAADALIRQARRAPLVLLRGRTDGSSDSPADARIARDRSLAVRDFLVAGGVDPARIRATYQPAGDRVADNDNAAGRALNRRVEIELYRELPVAVDITASAH